MSSEIGEKMVQGIYNNYAPQINYNQYRTPNNAPKGYAVAQVMSKPQGANQPYIYRQEVAGRPTYPLWSVPNNYPLEVSQTQSSATYKPSPAVNAAVQEVYNAPVYAQQYYSSPTSKVVPAPTGVQPFTTPNPFVTPPSTTQAPTQVAPVDPVPWVQDPELKLALTKLSEITHNPADVAHLNSIGVNPPYTNGLDALNFIRDNQIKVEFTNMGDSLAHAQWINDENKIGINQKYKGKMTLPMALAIADAIYHEAGHAKDQDGIASIQEELNCLSLNVLGYRYQQKHYPEIMNAGGQSRLISDGVALYPKLFFDTDPQKKALIKRVTEKYGFLPVNTPNHPSTGTPLAAIIKQNYLNAVSMQQPTKPAA